MRRILPESILLYIVGITEAISPKETAKGRHHDPSVSRFDDICSILRNVFLLVMASAVCCFLY